MKLKKSQIRIVRIIAILLLLFVIFRGIFVLGILILLSLAISFFMNNTVKQIRMLGIELVTFTAVLTALKYGPWIALILTFILITYHMIAGFFINTYIFWVIPAYSIGAFIVGLFPGADIVRLGIYLSIGINLNNLFFTALTSPGYVPRYLIFVITNILFNMFLFTVIGNFVFSLIV